MSKILISVTKASITAIDLGSLSLRQFICRTKYLSITSPGHERVSKYGNIGGRCAPEIGTTSPSQAQFFEEPPVSVLHLI